LTDSGEVFFQFLLGFRHSQRIQACIISRLRCRRNHQRKIDSWDAR
jgi:hypothetical protein